MEAEVQGYLTELGILKEQIREAIQNLNDEAVNWRPLLKDTNSIYAILCHLVGSEEYWVRQVIGGESIDRDREAEFRASGHVSEIIDRWERIGKISKNILNNLGSPQLGESRTLTRATGVVSYTVRWSILHIISHYAIHLGHIQLTRQLWEQR
ncbi:DinB family protein [Chloroflexota bacterium]